MHHISKKVLLLLTASLLALSLNSCFEDEKEIAKRAVDTLDKAIATLDSNSAKWQDVLKETRDKLVAESQSTIRNEITNLINNGIAASGVEVRCELDFIRKRMRRELVPIRNKLALKANVPPLPESSLEPEVCQVVPAYINFSLDETKRNVLQLSGYDFDKESITVILLNGNEEINAKDNLTQNSKYSLVLNLSSTNGITLSDKSSKIIVKTKTGKLISEIPVIQPQKPPDNSQFITYLKIISEGSRGNHCPSSTEQIQQDLNQGAGGKFIYLCYSKGGTNKPITDLQVTSSGSAGNQCGAGWEWYPQDLNEGAGGDFIYLCSRTEDRPDRIKEIQFTSTPNPGNFCPPGWNWINKDLNKGTKKSGDPYIYLCYLR